MEETTTEEDFHQLICSSDYEFVLECGVTKPAVTMHLSDKEKMISAVCLHYAVLGSLAELEQLRRGLHTLRFSALMESYPTLFKQLFLHCKTSVTADFIQDLFHVDYSVSGSNNSERRGNNDELGIISARFRRYMVCNCNCCYVYNISTVSPPLHTSGGKCTSISSK